MVAKKKAHPRKPQKRTKQNPGSSERIGDHGSKARAGEVKVGTLKRKGRDGVTRTNPVFKKKPAKKAAAVRASKKK